MKRFTKVLMLLVFSLPLLAFQCNPTPTPSPNQGFFVRVTANGIQTGADLQGFYVSGNSTSGTLSQNPDHNAKRVWSYTISQHQSSGCMETNLRPGIQPGRQLMS